MMTTRTSRWQRAFRGWFDPPGSRCRVDCSCLDRISGLALALYLVLHLMVLTTLARGEAGWASFLRLARTRLTSSCSIWLCSPAILYHALNRVRVSLIGLGYGGSQQKALFWRCSSCRRALGAGCLAHGPTLIRGRAGMQKSGRTRRTQRWHLAVAGGVRHRALVSARVAHHCPAFRGR